MLWRRALLAVAETHPAAPVPTTTAENLGATFSALRGSLRGYLRRRVGDSAVIDDLIQDVFVKAAATIAANRAPRNLTAWLYAVARTTVVDHYRSVRSDITALDDDLPDTSLADDEAFHQELATCLRPLTLQRPALYRDTLIAIDLEGRTMATLAKEQGLSLSAIKSRASRARRMLKEKLLECCDVETSNGAVTDYSHRVPGACGNGCA